MILIQLFIIPESFLFSYLTHPQRRSKPLHVFSGQLMLNYDIFGARADLIVRSSCETFANCSVISDKEADRLGIAIRLLRND
jgi:hypothetical protein